MSHALYVGIDVDGGGLFYVEEKILKEGLVEWEKTQHKSKGSTKLLGTHSSISIGLQHIVDCVKLDGSVEEITGRVKRTIEWYSKAVWAETEMDGKEDGSDLEELRKRHQEFVDGMLKEVEEIKKYLENEKVAPEVVSCGPFVYKSDWRGKNLWLEQRCWIECK